MEHLLLQSKPRMTQFTGSTKIAEKLSKALHGKVRIEGGGMDWKIVGKNQGLDSGKVYEICAKDAYSFSGQKCSAQSLLFIHASWDLLVFQNNLPGLKKMASTKKKSRRANDRTNEVAEIVWWTP